MKLKNLVRLALCAMVSVSLSGCFSFGGGGSSEEPSYKVTDLQGYWQENGTEHYVRFTNERSDEYPYYLGYEWHEDDEVMEQDLLDAREELGHPGLGWFKYELKTSGTLTEIHLMDNGGGEIPKVYVVSKLTDDELVYYEKDHSSIKYKFSKIVSPK